MDGHASDASTAAAPIHRALAAFQHPLVWAAIALLLINDHVLKTAAPGWLTGKLSDFAGLFFFPFLLAVPLAAILPRRVGTHVVGAMAFGLTAAWFAAIKTFAPANAFTADLVGALLSGGPARIALDPTDLVALAVLWPAWRLWRRPHAPSAPVGWPRRAAGTVALGLAALATMATSPPPHAVVTRLAIDGGMVYASGQDMGGIERSEDGGESWHQEHLWSDPDLSTHGPQGLYTNRPSPVVQCVPGDPRTCYRTAPAGRVEVSRDGGVSWSTAWTLPRQDYKRQLLAGAPSETEEAVRPFDPGPYDLVVLPVPGGYRLIVALGSEGVAVRTPDGEWAQWPTTMAYPTPPRAESIYDALVVSRVPLLLALLLAPALGWALQRRSGRRSRFWPALLIVAALAATLLLGAWDYLGMLTAILLPFVGAIAVVLPVAAIAVAVTAMRRGGLDPVAYRRIFAGSVVGMCLAILISAWWMLDSLAGFALALAPLLVGVGLVIAVMRTQRSGPDQPPPVAPEVLGAAGTLFLAIWLPFVLWAFGVLPYHALAVFAAVVGAVATIAWGWRVTGDIGPAATPDDA